MSDVIAPPYDIINGEKQEELYKRSEYNIVRIDFGKTLPDDSDAVNKYTRASQYLHRWMKGGVIQPSEKPAYYVYESHYRVHSDERVMRGIFGAVKLVDLGYGVYPHEETYAKPKTDRLNLMHACHGNTSPIFSLYNHRNRQTAKIIGTVCGRVPYLDIEEEERHLHRCRVVNEEDMVRTITEDLMGRDIFIADGHHRYETALEFKNQTLQGGANNSLSKEVNYVLMLLVNIADGGLTVLPTHRLIRELPHDPFSMLEPYFDIEYRENPLNIAEALSGKRRAFGLFLSGRKGIYILQFKGTSLDDRPPVTRDVDVMILHELIFKKLYNVKDFGYEMDVERTLQRVRDGEYRAAFFLNPTDVGDVERSAKMGIRMPPKSTYFFPKIPTGLVMNHFNSMET